jgi:hypothetical protein
MDARPVQLPAGSTLKGSGGIVMTRSAMTIRSERRTHWRGLTIAPGSPYR